MFNHLKSELCLYLPGLGQFRGISTEAQTGQTRDGGSFRRKLINALCGTKTVVRLNSLVELPRTKVQNTSALIDAY